MKTVFILAFVLFSAESFSLNIICPEFWKNAVVVADFTTEPASIDVQNYLGPHLKILASNVDDCQGKAEQEFVCFQYGQFMVNIPAVLVSAKPLAGQIWINADTDDNAENSSMGEKYNCRLFY